MIDIIKYTNVNRKINKSDLFNLLKTKSQKTNTEILSKLQNFDKFPDFYNYYLNKDFYKNYKHLYKLIHNFSNNDNALLETNIDKYISCTTKIILLLNLIFESQEILNKILISLKSDLNSLNTKNKIKNINQEILFNSIDTFLNNSRFNLRSDSNASTAVSNISSLDLIPHNSLFKNYSSEKEEDKLYDETAKTARFEEVLSTIFEEQIEELNENNKNHKKSSELTFSNIFFVNEKNESEESHKEKDNKKLQDFLIMINELYRKTLINAEEKIKLKKMVLNKSLKIAKFYNDIYQNPNTNKEKLIEETKKLLN